MNEEIKKAFEELARQIKELVHMRIEEYGVNTKVGKNTLKGSRLEKSIGVSVVQGNTIEFRIADYFGYIVTGRRKGWPRFVDGHTFVPAIDEWVTRKGILFDGMNHEQTVWACVMSIVKKGIPPRPFLGNPFESDDPSVILPFLDDLMDEWFDELFKAILTEIDNFFK